MSADNYMLIVKEKGRYVGYQQNASADEQQFDSASFFAETIEEAIYICQSGRWGSGGVGYLEYGYRFLLDKNGKITEVEQ